MDRRTLVYGGLFFGLSALGSKWARLFGGGRPFVVQTTLCSEDRTTRLPENLNDVLFDDDAAVYSQYQDLLNLKLFSGDLVKKDIVWNSPQEFVIRHHWSSERAFRAYRDSQEVSDVLAVLAKRGIHLYESFVG